MNRLETRGGEAKIRYLDGDFQVLVPGNFVYCAVTGNPIPISNLRYWSVDRQEAYEDIHASLARELDLRDTADQS